jgi:hypothetical protein
MCQTLGLHRKHNNRNEGYVFWLVYYIDKALSLLLGRLSTLQDIDIAVGYPEISTNPEQQKWDMQNRLLMELSRIQGRVYWQLYSNTALQNLEIRGQNARTLGAQLQDWRTELASVGIFLLQPAKRKTWSSYLHRGDLKHAIIH